ncbi:MAG: hypothetical protein GX456_01735 [Verrucomicrobia bacterium]|nr:hypothetical protein [Verrucomicrobiota bacterium]
MVSLDRAADPDGFSRAAAHAVRVGKREALGVRQLAAALFLCANNVPAPVAERCAFKRRTLKAPFTWPAWTPSWARWVEAHFFGARSMKQPQRQAR